MKLWLVILLLGVAAGHSASTPGPTVITTPEQEVLSAFLSPGSGFQSAGTTNFVVMETTASSRVREAAGRLRDWSKNMDFDGPLRDALDDLIRKSAVDLRVTVPSNEKSKVTTINEEERALILPILPDVNASIRAGWSRFFQRFPGAEGITIISRIGIDGKRTTAILDVTESANGGGGTRFYVLRRQGNAWHCTGEPILPMENRYSSIQKWLNQTRQPTPVASQRLFFASVSRRGCAGCSQV